MARLLRHALIVTVLAVTSVGVAWGADVLPTGTDPAASEAERSGATAPDRSGDREVYFDLVGYRFIAAEMGRVRPVAPPQDLIDAVRAVVPEVPAPEAAEPAPAEAAARSVWDRLADCESGDWRNGTPQPGTARWDYGLTFSHGDIFEGGVNFHPQTWDSYKDAGMPGHAGQATRGQQIAVAERVLADQGWGAWPVCSRKLGLR